LGGGRGAAVRGVDVADDLNVIDEREEDEQEENEEESKNVTSPPPSR